MKRKLTVFLSVAAILFSNIPTFATDTLQLNNFPEQEYAATDKKTTNPDKEIDTSITYQAYQQIAGYIADKYLDDSYTSEDIMKIGLSAYLEEQGDEVLVPLLKAALQSLDDYSAGAVSAIRATEKTVVERIPPRMRVRRNAAQELPHILMLCDDHEKVLIEPIAAQKDQLNKLYDFDLMEDGGHICGWLVEGDAVKAFEDRLTTYTAQIGAKYKGLSGIPMVFAVGDGNHSLATAKACYEELKAAHRDQDLSNHPARIALVELENIHDDAQVFEPIHRILTHTNPEKLLADLRANACAEGGFPVEWYTAEDHGTLYLDRAASQLAVGALQQFLDAWMQTNEAEIDYIHGDEDLKELAAQENAIGFLLPAMEKSQLFRGVIADGVLPRKTFSMGHAREKRYYLEGRAIR